MHRKLASNSTPILLKVYTLSFIVHDASVVLARSYRRGLVKMNGLDCICTRGYIWCMMIAIDDTFLQQRQPEDGYSLSL